VTPVTAPAGHGSARGSWYALDQSGGRPRERLAARTPMTWKGGAHLPSFDVVSEVNFHEVGNALDQATKEVTTRFDLKSSGSRLERTDNVINLASDSDFHLEQVVQVLMGKLAKRGVDLKCLKTDKPVPSGKEVRQTITVRHGIESAMGKEIVKTVKDSKIKVQASIQEDKVRVTGKKRDDLQAVIALLKQQDFGLPLQFSNFRD
jgi:cyclic-di-GMP-binding protein